MTKTIKFAPNQPPNPVLVGLEYIRLNLEPLEHNTELHNSSSDEDVFASLKPANSWMDIWPVFQTPGSLCSRSLLFAASLSRPIHLFLHGLAVRGSSALQDRFSAQKRARLDS